MSQPPLTAFDFTQWVTPEALAALSDRARLRYVPARGLIYGQGQPGDEMFRIRSGLVRLSVMQRDGRELLYQLFEPGDCFGTSSIVDSEPRPQTAEAFEDVEVEVFSRTTIDELRLIHPSVNDALLRLLSRHMRLLSDYFAGFAFDELSCRLAQRIVEAIDTFGVPVEGGHGFSRAITQTELSLMVGGTRQSVNRVLGQFRDAGLVATRNNRLVVRNLPELRQIAARGWKLRHFPAGGAPNLKK
jgi:CRP/FNR family cyclic AMP-dependent transcriptional regulator